MLSFLDERLLSWKLEAYLEDRVSAASAITITNIAVGAATLVGFIANSIVFLTNLLLSLTLYGDALVHAVVVFVVIVFIIGLFYGLLLLCVRKDVVDIVEHKFARLHLATWLRVAQIGYNLIALVLLGFGLYLSSLEAHGPHKSGS